MSKGLHYFCECLYATCNIMNTSGVPIEKVYSIEWMLIPLMVMLVSYALIRHSRGRVLIGTVQQFITFNVSNQSFRDEGTQIARVSGFLMINTFIGISILLYKILSPNVSGMELYLLYPLILIGVLIVFFIKKGIVDVVKTITDSGDIINQANTYTSKYYEALGILMLPGLIALLLFPSNSNIHFSLFGSGEYNVGLIYFAFIFSILYIIKLLQSARQSFDVKVSWYYIILYLCTLEILPLVVLYRLLVGEIWVFN